MSGRVIVTDAEERAVLGACRGLASAGYRVSAVASRRPAPTHWSRSCSERLLAPDPRDSVRAFVARLEQLLDEDDYAALIPGSDGSLLAISEHRDRLEQSTRLGLPPREAVRKSMDKVQLHRVAASVGLPPPASRSCAGVSEGAAAAAELGYPIVVKPGSSFSRAGEGLRQERVTLIENEAALLGALQAYAPPFIVQRFEHAGFLSCAGVIANGQLIALTTSSVPRLWPPIAGMHAFSETVAAPAGLAARVRALLCELGWEGIFQLQMLERADGGFSVIDLNPRVFASMTLDHRAGANLAAIWCEWLLGGRPIPVTASPGFRYRWEEGELCHLVWQLRRGRLRAAASVLLPHRRVVHAWFRVTDPAPLLARALELALKRVRPGPRRDAPLVEREHLLQAPPTAPALTEPGRSGQGQ
jgi:predicted ATP-grasp superfamily ATP-dependent carboligase